MLFLSFGGVWGVGCAATGAARPCFRPCRAGDRHARPAFGGLSWPCGAFAGVAFPAPWAGVPRAPPRANAREGGACAASARGGFNCGPPQGQGLQQQPAAGAPAWLGGGTPSEGPRAATPGGECVGRAERPGLRRRRGRAGKAGRSAADRAGGADGPKAPTSGGRAAPEHLRRNRRGGGAKQGPPQAACLGLALRRGAPAQRLAANLTRTRRRRGFGRHISPARPRRGLDGAGGGTAAAQGGQGVGPQAGGAGGTWPARRRDADGSPFPQAARPPERTKKVVPTGHSLLFWLDKGRPASRPDRWRLAPAPT